MKLLDLILRYFKKTPKQKSTEKKDDEKKLFNAWIKIEINKKIFNEINNTIEDNFKEIALKEVTINEIIKEIENEKNITIPKFVVNNLC